MAATDAAANDDDDNLEDYRSNVSVCLCVCI